MLRGNCRIWAKIVFRVITRLFEFPNAFLIFHSKYIFHFEHTQPLALLALQNESVINVFTFYFRRSHLSRHWMCVFKGSLYFYQRKWTSRPEREALGPGKDAGILNPEQLIGPDQFPPVLAPPRAPRYPYRVEQAVVGVLVAIGVRLGRARRPVEPFRAAPYGARRGVGLVEAGVARPVACGPGAGVGRSGARRVAGRIRGTAGIGTCPRTRSRSRAAARNPGGAARVARRAR